MVSKNLPYQWFFSDKPGNASIVLYHPEIYLWIGRSRNDQLSVIGIYDLILLPIGYVVKRNHQDEPYSGEVRPLRKLPDGSGYQDAHWSEFWWMKYENKERMLRLMRRAISFRTTQMPSKYSQIWGEAVATVQFLDIVNAGSPRYTS
jgi:hypothetical protein